MAKSDKHSLWVEKYRPRTLSEYVFNDPLQRKTFEKYVADRSIPHLLLSGLQGAGKTSIAQILINEMELDEADVITINASDERGIDTFRTTIKSFSSSLAMGRFKIILLEEADQLTVDAQSAMKRFMEEYSESVRFILTCNNSSKIIPPIASRCSDFTFKAADINDITERMVALLVQEKVEFNLDLLDKYVAFHYPDLRKIINTLQANTIDGVLQEPTLAGSSGDWKYKLLPMIETDKWVDARALVCSAVAPGEWQTVYRFLYENIHRSKKFADSAKFDEAVIVIAEHLYKNTIVADQEICMAACIIRLGMIASQK